MARPGATLLAGGLRPSRRTDAPVRGGSCRIHQHRACAPGDLARRGTPVHRPARRATVRRREHAPDANRITRGNAPVIIILSRNACRLGVYASRRRRSGVMKKRNIGTRAMIAAMNATRTQ
jgi:hypothetical protein